MEAAAVLPHPQLCVKETRATGRRESRRIVLLTSLQSHSIVVWGRKSEYCRSAWGWKGEWRLEGGKKAWKGVGRKRQQGWLERLLPVNPVQFNSF